MQGRRASGDRVYVSGEQGVVVLETATSAPIGTIATEQVIRDLAVDPTGTRAAFPTQTGSTSPRSTGDALPSYAVVSADGR